MKKVLVAVDGSEPSKEAFRYSLQDATESGSHITILRVVSGFRLAGVVHEKALKDEIRAAEEFTKKLETEAKKEGIDVDAKVITGIDVATEIAKFADKEGYDLIVVGSRGKTELETISLGSVSEGVVRRAHCPVLVVR